MTLKVGMLGYTFMGTAHSNALARLPMFFPEAPETERHVLVGRREKPLAEAADRFGFTKTTTDWRETLDEVDIFLNLGPNHVHVEPSIEALDRDIHVLSEKPLATSKEGAERMADAAAESDAVTATGFNYRFVPAIQYAKDLVEDGELGEIRHFTGRYMQGHLAGSPDADWSWRLSKEHAGAGALGDLGAHTIDLARFLVGDVRRLSGHCRTFVDERPVPGKDDESREIDVDDAYSAQLDFENGAMGVIEATRHAAGEKNNNSIEIHGTKGSLKFSLERLNEIHVYREGDSGYQRIPMNKSEDPYGGRWWPPGHNIGWEHTFVHEYAEFLTAIDEGTEHRPDFADGAAVQRIIDAVQRSDEQGRWLTL
ncbi:Gfo/Idh/MocA family protein [Halorussus salinisoli]|uniref:Gfo/Idh/MocA family protein n=1 Tax=Halorussus salinisoli TaxID=2558242 RepID=UPI0010C1FD08|nr:Gfo/Idh/MocA family oxidoreductase [Halorussus salinisoli]